MKTTLTIKSLKSLVLAGLTALALSAAVVPSAQASVETVRPAASSHTPITPQFGGKDGGNESHGSALEPQFGGGGKDGNESHG